MKYIPLFILVQAVSLVLTVIGIPICAVLAYSHYSDLGPDMKWHWPAWAWLWDNNEDGTMPWWYVRQNSDWSNAKLEFHWTALRNPCNNLRYVRGVSKVGRPLWRKTWTMFAKRYYFQAGWNGSGFPVLSGGINIHND